MTTTHQPSARFTAAEVETLKLLITTRLFPDASPVYEADDETGTLYWSDAETDEDLLTASRDGGSVLLWEGPMEKLRKPDRTIRGDLREALGLGDDPAAAAA